VVGFQIRQINLPLRKSVIPSEVEEPAFFWLAEQLAVRNESFLEILVLVSKEMLTLYRMPPASPSLQARRKKRIRNDPPLSYTSLSEDIFPMSDGREEREELEKRRQQEQQENREDRLHRDPIDPWQPERPDS
jgi:hypothetical protein